MTNPLFRRGGAAAVLAALLLAACSSAEKLPPPAGPPAPVQSPGRAVLTVTDAQSGAPILLDRAQVLVVRLPLNVATRLDWSLVDFKPGVLEPQGSKFETERRSLEEDQVGTVVWRFVPSAAGTAALHFDLRRPRDLAPAVRTLRYTVTVR